MKKPTTSDKYTAKLATVAAAASSRGRDWRRSDECIGAATHCGCCGHPLKDALSVQVACGPDCRARFGFDKAPTDPDFIAAKTVALNNGVAEDAVDDWADARKVCNLLLHVYALAAEVNPWVPDAVFALGYRELAGKLDARRQAFIDRAKKRAEKEAAEAAEREARAKRYGTFRGSSFTFGTDRATPVAVTAPVQPSLPTLAPVVAAPVVAPTVTVTKETLTDTYNGKSTTREVFTVAAPYSDTFNAQRIPGRWFDRTVRVWRVPVASQKPLWAALRVAFPGVSLVSDKGATVIAEAPKAN